MIPKFVGSEAACRCELETARGGTAFRLYRVKLISLNRAMAGGGIARHLPPPLTLQVSDIFNIYTFFYSQYITSLQYLVQIV